MPGTVMHLALAQMVYAGIESIGLDKIKFLSGNILPDEAVDKEMSHYRSESSVKMYRLPHMAEVKRELFDLNDPYKLGAYCHLYFDYHFFEDHLFHKFLWDDDKVISKKTGKAWQIKDFWSRPVFYSSYGALNHFFINDGYLNMEDVQKMPEPLPYIGNERFDNRRDKTWKKELFYFLEIPHEYTGEILEYEEAKELMRKIANDLIEEIKAAA